MVNDEMVNLFVPLDATVLSEWIPTLNLFREGACRRYNKNCTCTNLFCIFIEKGQKKEHQRALIINNFALLRYKKNGTP